MWLVITLAIQKASKGLSTNDSNFETWAGEGTLLTSLPGSEIGLATVTLCNYHRLEPLASSHLALCTIIFYVFVIWNDWGSQVVSMCFLNILFLTRLSGCSVNLLLE